MPENIRRASFKIVIKRIEKPFSRDPFAELDWICQSFGFFEPIDRGKTASSIFKVIVKGSEAKKPLTSTSLAKRLEMSRGSIINHLNNLQRSGLVVRQGRFYLPRSSSMLGTIEEIEEDIERIFTKMKKTALDLDRELGVAQEQKE
ncbi:MAG: helix-turn-helix transcriptional regulator [Candidatus Diapherotrites archaeon]|nr:helix-turn-helix transcriptional regulator [Candidatus Diapherotrites archaeon]